MLKSLKLRVKGFKFLLELLIRTKAKRVKEVPFVFEERKHGKSKLNISEYFNFLLLLLELKVSMLCNE